MRIGNIDAVDGMIGPFAMWLESEGCFTIKVINSLFEIMEGDW